MGEIKINPLLNVHQNYNRVNIVNPYRYGSGGGAPVGGVDADYQAVLDFASNNAIPLPSTAQQEADNQLMIDYKATGSYDTDDFLFKFNGTADPLFRLICWKRKVVAIASGGLTWSTTGVKGNGTTGYINTNFKPSIDGVNYTLNDAGFIYKTPKQATAGLKCLIGIYSGTVDDYILIAPNNANNSYTNINGQSGTHSSYSHTGLTTVSRVAPEIVRRIWTSTQDKNSVQTDSFLTSSSIYLLARHRSDTGGADLFSDEELSFVSGGGRKDNVHNAVAAIL